MLVLKNNQVLKNSDVNSLQIVNTNGFSFGVINTGPIRVSWGDGSYTDVGIKSSKYTINKTYLSIGTYNITITGVDDITGLYFDVKNHVTKINSNVIWFSQFKNLINLTLINATFIGDLAPVINNLLNLKILDFNYTPILLNISKCPLFWNRAINIHIITITNNISGLLDDIDINNDIEYLYLFFGNFLVNGDLKGIMKNSYTKIISFGLYLLNNPTNSLITNFEDWVIPNTLLKIENFRTARFWGNASNFNFKNMINFTSEGFYTSMDFSNNQSFKNMAANNLVGFGLNYMGSTPIKINLADFTKSSFNNISIYTSKNYNQTYGDITYLSTHVTSRLNIQGCKNDGAIFGIIDNTFSGNYLALSYIDVTITADQLKLIYNRCFTYIVGLPNVTGDISGCVFKNHDFGSVSLYEMSNLYADVTTFTFDSTLLSNNFIALHFMSNPHFTGDLANFPLWGNKSAINLSNCAYTNIPGFVNKIFTSRNTCLKAAGGITTISIQGNIDNNLLTGTETQPSLGTYTGNINNLIEAQIDNLANGLDVTGIGTNTPWTYKEKIWFLKNLKNSSTDSSLRYRVTLNY